MLGFPDRLTQDKATFTITSMRLDAAGQMVAALVRRSGSKSAHFLVVWMLVGYDAAEGVAFNPDVVEWRCMGCAFVGAIDATTEGTVTIAGGVKRVEASEPRGQFCLAWLPTGALLVLKAQSAAASPSALVSTNGLIMLSLIAPEVIYSGQLAVNWNDQNQVIESPLGKVCSITALPGVVVDDPSRDAHVQVPTVHVVIVGETRVMMVALTAHKNPVPGDPQADLARVVWSDVSEMRYPVTF